MVRGSNVAFAYPCSTPSGTCYLWRFHIPREVLTLYPGPVVVVGGRGRGGGGVERGNGES